MDTNHSLLTNHINMLIITLYASVGTHFVVLENLIFVGEPLRKQSLYFTLWGGGTVCMHPTPDCNFV